MNGNIDSVAPAMRGSKWISFKNWMTFKHAKIAMASFHRTHVQAGKD
jgi:hypothetical protein